MLLVVINSNSGGNIAKIIGGDIIKKMKSSRKYRKVLIETISANSGGDSGGDVENYWW